MNVRVFRKNSLGFISVYVIVAGFIMLFTGMVLFDFIIHRYFSSHVLQRSQKVHLLAEAGVSYLVQAIRLDLVRQTGSKSHPKLLADFLATVPFPDQSVQSYLPDTWSLDLKDIAAKVDPSATLNVEGWFQDFTRSETALGDWNDPSAQSGVLYIVSTARIGNQEQKLTAKRAFVVSSILPPVSSKFTLRLRNEFAETGGRFNVVRNDYDGNFLDGASPTVLLNHATPGDPLTPVGADKIKLVEQDPNLFEKRGWIWVEGNRISLDLSSGVTGAFGESFYFSKIDYTKDPRESNPVRFVSPNDKLPPTFPGPMDLPWGSEMGVTSPCDLKQSFLMEGFHDKSERLDSDAMYEGAVISNADKDKFGSKSSSLRLFGKTLEGYKSHTKVFGNVFAAFPRFSIFDPKPVSGSDGDGKYQAMDPPPLLFLPGLATDSYAAHPLTDFMSRACPYATGARIFPDYASYSVFMSGIVEYPFTEMYNSIIDTENQPVDRTFPAKNQILSPDQGFSLELKRSEDSFELYRGPIQAEGALKVMEKRVQIEVQTIEQFWRRFYATETKSLELNNIVRIVNPATLTFEIPAREYDCPMEISGGGMIVLEAGDVRIGGVLLKKDKNEMDALTVVAPRATQVFIADTGAEQPHHLNLIAPKARLTADAPLKWYGTLEIGGMSPENLKFGGEIAYREAQDPTQSSYRDFYRAYLAEMDKTWHD